MATKFPKFSQALAQIQQQEGFGLDLQLLTISKVMMA